MNYNRISLVNKISVSDIITMLRVERKEGHRFRGESHNFPELVYLSQGWTDVLLDGTPHRVNEGDAILYAPNSFHDDIPGNPDSVLYVISFDTEEPLPSSLFNHPFPLSQKGRQLLSDLFSKESDLFGFMPKGSSAQGMYFRGEKDGVDLNIIKSSMELLLLDLYDSIIHPSCNPAPGPMGEKRTVTEFLRQNISQTLSVEEISLGCSMSVSKLKKLFAEGVIHYFNEMKIATAQELIRNSNMNFTQIAEHLGFGSVHYFSRLFKAKTGMSPSEFSRNL